MYEYTKIDKEPSGHLMMKAATIARLEGIVRPIITRVQPRKVVATYSSGRLGFLKRLNEEVLSETYTPPETQARILWGIKFLSPIMNAAGMFKNGECFNVVVDQGAGAYLGGTGTWNARRGNEKEGIHLPFTPYPRSHAASNWLGLPNDGDEVNAGKVSWLPNWIPGRAKTPVGWSIMGSPDLQGEEKLEKLVEAMNLYDEGKVDFLELNESCPNACHGRPQDNDLANRLKYVKERFLSRRTRRLPVIVKFSNDTEVEQVPALLDLLFGLGYDGINLGNTSTNYALRRERIDPRERRLFDFFTQTFGGGVSGRPLKESSLELAARAVAYTKAGPPSQEFHVIRTGGIETLYDIQESEGAGIQLNQWFTGYFESFAKHGHNVYRRMFSF